MIYAGWTGITSIRRNACITSWSVITPCVNCCRRICDLPPPREGEQCRRIGSILWRRHVQRHRQIQNDLSPDEKG